MPDPKANPPEPSLPAPNIPHGLDVLRTYGEGFAGREAELAALHQAWDGGAVRVFVLYAQGGAGKTRVIAKWLTELRDAGWPKAGPVFVHSFYSQGSDERRNASSELFFEQALSHFGHSGPPLTDSTEKGRMLARLLVEQHGLLVLDGLEPLQQPPAFDQGRLKDPAIQSLLLALAAGRIGASSGRGLCVVTSRQPVTELQDKTGRTVLQQPLDRLDAAAGVMLLRQLDVHGPERELREAVEDARGHAYSLMLLGSYLRDATDDHEIRRRREIPLLEEDKENHARHLFAAYVQHLGESSAEVTVLRLLGFFDRPAEEKLLAVLREAPEDELGDLIAPLRSLSPADRRRVLRRLADLRLIDVATSPSPPIDSHPLLREYFAEQLRTRFPEAWQAGHRRLFEHLCETTEYWPDTLVGLQPLYQAVAHGCLAGLHQQACDKVYSARITRGTRHYSTRKLGAMGADLGAVACFFATAWSRIEPTLAVTDQAWLLTQAAYRLRALGRLTEAVEPLLAGIEIAIGQMDWESAALYSSNLSELKLAQGEVSEAVTAGGQSVKYADRSEILFRQRFDRAKYAAALHQAGRREESRRMFEEAEGRQASHPRLHSAHGFRYCDLLLADAEREAWRAYLLAPLANNMAEPLHEKIITACDIVSERASDDLRSAKHTGYLLDIALDHLTLARATLYRSHFALPIAIPAMGQINAAILSLRTAGDISYLPLGLLTRAWQLCLSGDEEASRADLDETWEIAERGPMPLFQADVQLTRARLFRDRVALKEARRLIEKHGYHRRDEELADAEEASREWPHPPSSVPITLPATGRRGATTQGTDKGQQSEDSMRDQVFISYSHQDKKLMEELQTHLKPFLRSGAITPWSDQQIAAGSQWFDEIQGRLSRTIAAVLLVSPDFLASDFIHEHELGPLLKEAKAGGVKILWVPLRASAYDETPLKHFQAVSPPDKPLDQMSKAGRNNAWVEICKEIKRAVNP